MITAEPTIPNTGRILDYWLGGTHHFPADVAAAQAFDAIYGQFPQVFRVLRNYIGRAARFIYSQGVEQFLVLGSGIPTQGNVHEAVPEAKVLYTDIDPVNVELGQQILAQTPNAQYTFCDATNLSTLDQRDVEAILDLSRPLGLVVIGVSVFIPDEQLRSLFSELYERVVGGSFLAFDFDSQELSKYPAALEMLGDGFYMRTPEMFAPLLGPWKLTSEGIQPVASWGMQEPQPDVPTFMYGGVAYKPH